MMKGGFGDWAKSVRRLSPSTLFRVRMHHVISNVRYITTNGLNGRNIFLVGVLKIISRDE